jgi:hypothetical protein
MRYPTYLEVGPAGSTLAYAFALPGVFVKARTADAALAAMPAAIVREHDRLTHAGRAVTGVGEAVEVVETERVSVESDVEHGVASALFRHDLRPTKDEEVPLALDRLELAREELLAAVAHLTATHGERWIEARARPAARAAGETLAHVADVEWWLLSRLGTRPKVILPAEVLERLSTVRAHTVERLTNLLPGDRERHAVFAGEAWTTRKVLRRLVCHERAHADALAALAAAAVPNPTTTR